MYNCSSFFISIKIMIDCLQYKAILLILITSLDNYIEHVNDQWMMNCAEINGQKIIIYAQLFFILHLYRDYFRLSVM